MATSNSRLAARISIICIVIFGLLVFTGIFFQISYLKRAAVPFAIIALLIKYFILRCQSCGWRGGIPQWSKNKTIHCPKCGTAYEYDR